MLYSAQTGGFYDQSVHGSIPADAVAISDAEHAALIAAQAGGKVIVADGNGRPIVVPPPLLPIADLKAVRNAYINDERARANLGTFGHAGKEFACDALSRGDIDGVNGYVALTGNLPPGFPGAWKAVDNSYLPLSDVAAWTAFYADMVAAGAANFAYAQQLKAQLAAATTAEEVAAVVW